MNCSIYIYRRCSTRTMIWDRSSKAFVCISYTCIKTDQYTLIITMKYKKETKLASDKEYNLYLYIVSQIQNYTSICYPSMIVNFIHK